MLNSAEYEIYPADNCLTPTVDGILTFISRIDMPSECFKQDKLVIFQYFTFFEQSKFLAQLS